MHAADEDDLQQAITQARQRQRPRPALVPIGDVVNRLLARRGYAQLQQGLEWDEVWRAAAGAMLARNSRPGRLNRDVLEIVVDNSAALQELSFQKSKLLKKLQSAAGGDVIQDLRFRIGQID